MRLRTLGLVAIGLLVSAGACRVSNNSGDGLCSLLGPCGNYNNGSPITISAVVGYPDSLVSTDPNNQIGVMPVGTDVRLHYMRATSSGTSGVTIYQAACASAAIVLDSLRWAVSDSGVAMVSGGGGHAALHATSPGKFSLLTTTIPSGAIDPRLWSPYVVACPSGRVLFTIQVVPR